MKAALTKCMWMPLLKKSVGMFIYLPSNTCCPLITYERYDSRRISTRLKEIYFDKRNTSQKFKWQCITDQNSQQWFGFSLETCYKVWRKAVFCFKLWYKVVIYSRTGSVDGRILRKTVGLVKRALRKALGRNLLNKNSATGITERNRINQK